MAVNSISFRSFARRLFVFSLVISVLFHVVVLWLTGHLTSDKDNVLASNESIEVQLVSKKLLEAVDSFQQEAKRTPESAKFASSRNLETEEETSPEDAASNVASGSSAQAQQAQPSPPQEKMQKPRKKESFSLSQDDLMAMNDPVIGSAAPRRGPALSPGFIRKLKRGEELKINALGLDYGQYLVRMKERLVNRWNPQRTINPEMYDYQEVSVTLAIVLNDRGEIEDLRILKGSFFSQYDQEAVRAFRDAGPFPNPPESLIQEDGKIYLPWSFLLSFRGWANSNVY